MTIVTRFAPSPTGNLHIGGARTALFNWLFAKHHGGKFLLRIEDTDKARSTEEAKRIILDSLKWLGLTYDDNIVYQLANANRHKEIAYKLVEMGKAYFCYTEQEEVNKLREECQAQGKSFLFESPWRDYKGELPVDKKPVIRLKAPRTGETILQDLVQGEVVVENSHIDDMVILRSDGTPTYMLAVVVDDHDMGVNYVIRGDDHLNNTFKQILIYEAMNWDIPKFAHIPLIHGDDGAKLSKRHGALSVLEYRDLGILPEALLNYLLRLGWSHGNDEIISIEQAIKWFNLEHVGKSPSRFDMQKLLHINAHYIKEKPNEILADIIAPDSPYKERLIKGLDALKVRAKTLNDLKESSLFYTTNNINYKDDVLALINEQKLSLLQDIIILLENITEWNFNNIKLELENLLSQHNIKLRELGEVIRIALTASTSSPGIFEILDILGKEESIIRMKNLVSYYKT